MSTVEVPSMHTTKKWFYWVIALVVAVLFFCANDVARCEKRIATLDARVSESEKQQRELMRVNDINMKTIGLLVAISNNLEKRTAVLQPGVNAYRPILESN